MALTRFKRILRRARLTVRQLTHTLHLPPALSEIYGGPNSFWLRDVLECLPNLQSLIVSGLPFFDHHSLIALRYASASRPPFQDSEHERPQYDLKLLLAEREPNTTSAALKEALLYFPHLVYLDLSYTSPARDPSVLAALANLWNLQVLKVRGVGMRDSEAEILANAVGIRVRLLDLRENHLTDMAVRSLMQACFLAPDTHLNGTHVNTRQTDDWSIGLAPGPDFLSLESLRSDDLDKELFKQLTHPLTGRLAFEDIPHKGLTHLYIADNDLSVEGLSSLLKSTRLHVLDGGSVDAVKTLLRSKSLSSSTSYNEVRVPGSEKLVSVLRTYASNNLTYLRVNHTAVTEAIQTKEGSPSPDSTAELASEGKALFEAPASSHYALELPSGSDTVFELSAEQASSKSGLPGDCVHFTLSSPIETLPDRHGPASGDDKMQAESGEGVFAPEVMPSGSTGGELVNDDEVVLNATGSGLSSNATPDAAVSNSSSTHATEGEHKNSILPSNEKCVDPTPSSPLASHIAQIETLLRKRSSPLALERRNADAPQTDFSDPSIPISTFLHPSHLPHLRTLVLTDVPALVPAASTTMSALLRFICGCADEAYLAMLQAQTNYSLPPGHSRHAAEIQHARSLFALRTIVLEMDTSSQPNTTASEARDHSRAKSSMLKSSTGDEDSEALWSAAENDFSFFDEEDECGIYQNEPEKYFPTARIDEKIALDPDDDQESSTTRLAAGPNSLASHTRSSLHQSRLRWPTLMQSPRHLPLGRNRSSSSAASNRVNESTASPPRSITPLPSEMTGTTSRSPSRLTPPPAAPPQGKEEQVVNLVAGLTKFRKEKKREHEDACLQWKNRDHINSVIPDGIAVRDKKDMPFVEGYWEGEIKIIRNATPKGRTGVVDMYGNYFEKGYLYP